MTVVSSNISNLLTVELDNVYFEVLGTLDWEPLINALFNVQTSSKKNEYGQTVGGFPLMAVKDEGGDATSRDWGEGYKTTYTHKVLAMYNPITEEARDDELHNCVQQIPAAMARSADATINYYGSRIFGRADNATEDFITGGDGVALLSASHPCKLAGGTFANTPSTAVDLTKTSLNNAINGFYEMLDDQGKPVRNRPKTLLIPHQSEDKAIELLQSNLDPDSANNAVNFLQRRATMNYVVWPYWLGANDSDCWFLIGDQAQWAGKYPLIWFWRKRPTTDSYNDFYSKDFMYMMRMRFSCGYDDPRFLYGSMGK